MKFDVATLYFTNLSVLFVAAAMSFAYWLKTRDAAVREWMLSTIAGAVGTLILGVFGPIPTMDPAIAGNGLIVAGIILAWDSVRRFNGRPLPLAVLLLLIVAFLLLFAAAWLLGASLRDRVVLASFALALFCFLAGWEMGFGAGSDHVAGRASLALIFAVVGIDMLIRVGGAVFEPPAASDIAFFDDPLQGHTLFALSIGLTCLGIGGLSTMAHERVVRLYERLALTDELTELPNRRCFLEQGERLARRLAGEGAPACVLMMDLDDFSRVNERFGHAGGDRALVAFADVLRGGLRQADLVARYGGEEFCALLPGASPEEARAVADRVRAATADVAIATSAGPLRFTVSLGVAPLHAGDLRAALAAADAALYRAKHAGRDRVAMG